MMFILIRVMEEVIGGSVDTNTKHFESYLIKMEENREDDEYV